MVGRVEPYVEPRSRRCNRHQPSTSTPRRGSVSPRSYREDRPMPEHCSLLKFTKAGKQRSSFRHGYVVMRDWHRSVKHGSLRIVETPPRFPPSVGGVEQVSQAVCLRLAAHGDAILVICANDPRGGEGFNDGRIRVLRLPWLLKVANTNITLSLPLRLVSTHWDVVSTHLPTPWSADWSILLGHLLRRGTVLSIHTTVVGEGWYSYLARLYMATVFRLTLRWSDRVLVLSDFWRDELLAVNKSIADRIRVIPNGVDLQIFTPGPRRDGRQLLFVSVLDRFHQLKGLDTLLTAMTAVRLPCDLVVVGDGVLRAEYEALGVRLGIAERVRFVGAIEAGSKELVAIYHEADLFVLPSRGHVAKGQEGLPLAALEAMATSLPVILADGVGQFAQDVQAAGAGVHVPADDPQTLAAALDRVLGDVDRREVMGRAARAYAERNYSWDTIADRRRAVYVEAAREALLRRKHGSRFNLPFDLGRLSRRRASRRRQSGPSNSPSVGSKSNRVRMKKDA